MPKKKYLCSNCKSEIYRYASTVRNPDRVFCSQKCLGKEQRISLRGKNNPNYKFGKQTIFCVCGKRKNQNSKYCSFCREKDMVEKTKKVKSAIGKVDSYSTLSKVVGLSRQMVTSIIERDNLDISHFNPSRGRFLEKNKVLSRGRKKKKLNC
tara:strand:+ start:3583 stop:4038 length:456 start_codon:yes stop_codon:yes gene_type:complete